MQLVNRTKNTRHWDFATSAGLDNGEIKMQNDSDNTNETYTNPTKLTEIQQRRMQQNMQEDTQKSASVTYISGELPLEEQSHQNSMNSGKQTKDWTTPRNVKELASQANKVATMVLNNKIDIETARSYSAITKTIAQAKSLEVQKARFNNMEPDMSLED